MLTAGMMPAITHGRSNDGAMGVEAMVKAFKGTVHVFMLNDKERRVVDPRTIPSDIRDALCLRRDYRLPSIIGPNHDVAHFDLTRQDWRDMRYAVKKHTFTDQSVSFDGTNLAWS